MTLPPDRFEVCRVLLRRFLEWLFPSFNFKEESGSELNNYLFITDMFQIYGPKYPRKQPFDSFDSKDDFANGLVNPDDCTGRHPDEPLPERRGKGIPVSGCYIEWLV